MLLGEDMPDKNDPKYKELHEQSFNAGASFARKTKLDVFALKVQTFASSYPKIFLGIIFSIVLFCIGLNLYRLSTAVNMPKTRSSVIQTQEHYLAFQLYEEISPTNHLTVLFALSLTNIAHPNSLFFYTK